MLKYHTNANKAVDSGDEKWQGSKAQKEYTAATGLTRLHPTKEVVNGAMQKASYPADKWTEIVEQRKSEQASVEKTPGKPSNQNTSKPSGDKFRNKSKQGNKNKAKGKGELDLLFCLECSPTPDGDLITPYTGVCSTSPDGDLITPCTGVCSTSPLDKESKLFSLDTRVSLTNRVTVPLQVHFKNTTNHFKTLIDTGAIQGNYARTAQVERLEAAGYPVEKCNAEVCAAFDNCQHSSKVVVMNVMFNNDDFSVLNKAGSFEVSLSFKILDDLPFDMIIGRDDIDLYDLWYKPNTTEG